MLQLLQMPKAVNPELLAAPIVCMFYSPFLQTKYLMEL